MLIPGQANEDSTRPDGLQVSLDSSPQVHFHSGSFLNHAGVKSTELFLQVNMGWSEEGHVGLRRLLGSKTQDGKGLSEDRKH